MRDALMIFSKRFAESVTLLRRKLLRITSDLYSSVAARIFFAFFCITYIIHFIVDVLATLFRQINAGGSSFSSLTPPELFSVFREVTEPYRAAGWGGIMTIMFFILLVSYVLTRLLLAPLKEASDKQKLFAANASHELRTPLSVLKTLAEVARMRSGNLSKEEVNTFAKDIGEEVDRMSHIIEFFVRFSALEDGEEKLQMAPVRLSRLVESVVHQLEYLAKEHGVHLMIAKEMTGRGRPGVVRGNFTALEELLANLVKNAIVFSPKGGTVRIASKVSDTNIQLAVTDNGRGISEEDLPHIFEPFYQSVSKRYSGGSGLGLTLVKQIAKLHRAKVEVKSKVGMATTFTVEFPM